MDKQTSPIVKPPVPCGRDNDLHWGREGSQFGWYELAGHRAIGRTVLDVGCGCGDGLDSMRKAGVIAEGIDVDTRLRGFRPDIRIADVSEITTGSYDVVTCMDVIEHVIEDAAFLRHLLRIARLEVIVSTPNGLVSKCLNQCHCREYTPAEFAEFFKPTIHLLGDSNGTTVCVRKGPGMDHQFPHQCGIWVKR